MMSNKLFYRPFSFHITAVYTEACVQRLFPVVAISVHSVLSQFTASCGLKG